MDVSALAAEALLSPQDELAMAAIRYGEAVSRGDAEEDDALRGLLLTAIQFAAVFQFTLRKEP